IMQNESNNIDDYTFAMRLQQKLYEDYNGLTHEIVASVANNAESAIDDDYATMQLQEMYNKERNVTHEDEDYAFAMQLQQLYNNELTNNRNKERVITKDDYEDLVPQMNNISFENSGENSEKFSNKSTNKKGGDRKGESYNDNFFQSDANKFDDDPPPYFSQRYSSNNSGMNNGYFPEQQFVPPQFPQQNYQKQNTTPNQPNYQDMFEMFTQFMGTFQNQNQKNSNQPNYDASYTHNFQRNNREPGVFKILLLGGTGTGKSTIINTMTNYFLGGTLDEPKIVIPTKYFKVTEKEFLNKDSETKIDDVTKSQTTKCHTYNFNHPDHSAYKFILIDTPGLSDTNGVKQDDKNIQEIIDAAIDAGSLSAIVIIANGTESRVTPSIKNTLVQLANNLPDDLLGNLLLVLTKCTKSSASFSEDAFSKEIAKPKKIFYMDNQFFCTNPQVWKDDDDERITVEFNWKKSNNTINKLLETIADLSSTSTKAFENMKEFRNRIKSEIVKVTQDIANIQKVQDSLEAAQKALQKTGNQKNSFANYTKSESITIKK
ncbi:6830_t:CDS:2, partial [Scutellospora calospora]